MRKILYGKWLIKLLTCFFSLFYDKKYLTGYFFTVKRMGWLWAWKGLKGRNKKIPYPVHPNTIVSDNKVHFDPNDINLFQTPGCYWQVHDAHIYVGKGSYVAPNVGLITTNHDPLDPSRHVPGSDIRIGEKCWIGMNAVILPGVTLGDHTVVGAGAVVTKSFPEGYVILGGSPAKVIKNLPQEEITEAAKQ